MKIILFPGCLGMVSPRSCFRIIIPGPARGAQTLFTVGPALIPSAREVLFIPVRDPGGDAHGMVRALAGGGCGTTRGSGRWKRAAGLQTGGEPRAAGVASDPARGGGLLSADTAARKGASSRPSPPSCASCQPGGERGSSRAGPGRVARTHPLHQGPAGNPGSRRRAPIPAPSRPAGPRGPLTQGPR